MESVKSNYFWYKNCSENVCTYIHKRGEKEGYMCYKKLGQTWVKIKKIFYAVYIVKII